MLIVNSIQELRTVAEKHNLINAENKILDAAILNTKFVPGDGKVVALKDAIEFVEGEKLPIVKESLRKDVYDFYNAQLTNFLNFKIINAVCDIATNENGEVFQYPIFVEGFMLDRSALLSMGESETRISVLLNEIDWMNLCRLSETTYDEVKEKFNDLENMDVLTFIYPVKVTKADRLKLPSNERLANEYLLTVNKPEEQLIGTGITRDMKDDIILFIGDETYIIRHNFLKMLTMRKSNLVECFAQNVHHY